MSRPLARVQKENPQIVELAARAKIEELHTIIAELRARRAEANTRTLKAQGEYVAMRAGSKAKQD